MRNVTLQVIKTKCVLTPALLHKRPKFCKVSTASFPFSKSWNAYRWGLPLQAWVGCRQLRPRNIPSKNYQPTQRNIPRRAQVLNRIRTLESRKVNNSGNIKFSAYCGTRRFITVFTKGRYWAISWARKIHTTPSADRLNSFKIPTTPDNECLDYWLN